jgi:hypothetical protein
VVEKTKFPRLVVGESLIPRVMDHFDEAGLLPALNKMNFEKKSIIVFSKSAAKVKIKTKESRISKTYFNHSVKQVQEDLILDMSNNDFEIIRYE